MSAAIAAATVFAQATVVRAIAVAMVGLVAWLGLPEAAQAQNFGCTATVSTLTFGNAITNPTTQVDVRADLTIACTGNGGERGDTLKVCVGLPAGARQMTSAGGGVLAYQIYHDAARTQAWGSRASGNTPEGLRILLNQDNKPSGETVVPIYGRIPSGQAGLPAGGYNAMIAAAEVTSGSVMAQPCGSISNVTANFNLPVQAIVPSSCSIVTSDLAFGPSSTLASAVDASAAIGLTCTAGLPYAVKLDGGLIGGAVGNRRMGLNGAGPGVINYQLYRDGARAQAWGNTLGNTVTGIGSGVASTLTVYGRVPAQATPPVGTYRDTVTATVEY